MNSKIKITYNKFLDPIFIAYIHSQEQWKNWVVPKQEEVKTRIEAYKEAWSKVETDILSSIKKITGLSYTRNVIDIHIVSGNPRPFSNPIVLKSGYPIKEFIEVLTEELIHFLFKEENYPTFKRIWDVIKSTHSTESDSVINHILVFSIMIEVYKQIGQEFNPEWKDHEINKEYIRALELAKKEKDQVLLLFK